MTSTRPRTTARGVADLAPIETLEVPAAPVEYRVARVADMPESERPRERLERLGAQSLRLDELLALLLRSGGQGKTEVMQVAAAAVREFEGARGLAAADVAALVARVSGIGAAKAASIVAAFELGRRLSMEAGAERPQITQPEHIAALLHDRMQVLEQEELHVLVLDNKNHVLAATVTYRGTVNAAGARVSEIYKEAVRRNAVKIALAHNHPSGDPQPSQDDVAITRQIVDAGKMLDIEVLDHLVFGHGANRWVSMRRQRLGFDGG